MRMHAYTLVLTYGRMHIGTHAFMHVRTQVRNLTFIERDGEGGGPMYSGRGAAAINGGTGGTNILHGEGGTGGRIMK